MSSLTTLLLFNVLFGNQQTEQYSEAYKNSQEKGQPLVVLVGAEWCPGCVKMKSQVIPEMKEKGILGDVQFAQVNTDQEAELAEQLMQGRSIPQLIMFTKTDTGWKRTQMTGPKTPAEVETFIQQNMPTQSLIRFSSTSK